MRSWRPQKKALRELSLHLLRTQDEERRRIGRELHDSLGQYLAMLKVSLDSLPSVLNENGAEHEIEKCVRLADDSLKELRTISYLLYPPMLEEVGLKAAVPCYAEGFAKRSKIQTTLDIDQCFGRLPPETELALFRVLQESLTNVHRHSGSSSAAIRLSLRRKEATLQVQDQGRGIPPEILQSAGQGWMGLGVGLRGMRERLRQLGGELEVSSNAQGTTVTAIVPVTRQPAATSTAQT
jgi:signal transduction histidine kinase